MKSEDSRRLNPLKSLFVTIGNCLSGKVDFPKEYDGKKIRMVDGQEFEIFRHVIIDRETAIPQHAAVFMVRFKLDNMSIEKNKRFSRFPIPMFIGLPGFKAKFWMCDAASGYNQGIYQWQSEQDAINYSQSFAVKFMTRRSTPGSVSIKILKEQNIYEFMEELGLT